MQFNCPAQQSGDLRSVAPPVPIPNTEVKRAFADGSASIGCARVGRCQYYEPRGRKLPRGSFFPAIELIPVRVVAGGLTLWSDNQSARRDSEAASAFRRAISAAVKRESLKTISSG